jgi:hemoglobin
VAICISCGNKDTLTLQSKEKPIMTASLFERLGGTEGITQIADDLVDIHLANPSISPRYVNSDAAKLKNGAATFFIAGTGGPNVYEGQNMLATHKGMNISGEEFLAVLDDALSALEKNNIGQREKEEVLFVLYSMKPEIVGV